MFSKMVKDCDWEAAANHALRLGFDGMDLTCRSEGHVLPENVKTDLPKAVEFFKSKGLEIGMISTGITTGEEPYTEDILNTAGKCGIKFVKMGYWWLGDKFGNAEKRLADAKRGAAKVAELAKAAGVCAIIHIHSGNCVNAIPTFIREILQDLDKNHIGAYIDPGHMAVEGGYGGWSIGMDILAPYTKLIAIKSFKWFSKQQDNYVEWYNRLVPLSEGIAPWPKVLERLKSIGYDGYISVHSEYQENDSWKVMTQDECLAQTAEDLKYFDSIGFR